jgi:hypothetical protein
MKPTSIIKTAGLDSMKEIPAFELSERKAYKLIKQTNYFLANY